MKEKTGTKICFAASSGGHFEQLMMLKPLMEKYDSFILTERTQYSGPDKEGQHYLNQINRREKTVLIKALLNTWLSLKIYLEEKPDIIVTTGVLAIIPMCLIMKVFGKKLIYVESFAKITSPTLTGRFLNRFADRFYVQWDSMLDVYPGATHVGSIY